MERILFEDIKDAIKHYIIGRKTKQMLLKMELVFVSYETILLLNYSLLYLDWDIKYFLSH